ncbi:MAG: prepilin-type N-terminal cleavage/methylation domain-containing protein [Planctomycetota bacterium]
MGSQFRRGLTLIELVVVMVLTAVLMLTATTVMRGLFLAQREIRPHTHVAEITRLVARDLINAEDFRIVESGFELRGLIGLDSELEIDLKPCVVRYEAEPVGEQVILWRRELRQGRFESIPLSVGQLQVAIADLADFELEATQNAGWYAVPAQVDLVLLDADRREVYRESVCRDSVSRFVGYFVNPVRQLSGFACLAVIPSKRSIVVGGLSQ